jgi:hypothetical protein
MELAMKQDQLLTRLRGLLHEALQMRHERLPKAHKLEAQAYADGYMRALTDCEQIGTDELLRLVNDERSRFYAAQTRR